ncbi:MAG: hypothetical protein K8R21_11145 [Leptospira sp.]|nr:hypothetical protein [Leptospira sp.]
MLNKFRYILLLFGLSLLSLSLSAETILLKNGKIVKGSVIDQNSKEISVKLPDGKTQKYPKGQVLKVIYKEVDEKEARRIHDEEEKAIAAKKKIEDDKKLAGDEKRSKEEADRKTKEAREAEARRTPLTRFGVAWRSAVLPGWGQWADKRKTPAIVFPALILLSGYKTYVMNQEYRNSVRDFNHLGSPYLRATPSSATLQDPINAYIYNRPFQLQRDTVDRHYRETRIFGALTLLIYILNVADAAYFHKDSEKVSGYFFDYRPASISKNIPNQTIQNSDYLTIGYFFTFD